MSLRISFGSRWFEFHLFSGLMLGAIDYLHIQYGHNSTRNLIRFWRNHRGTKFLVWKNKKAKIWKREVTNV